MDISMEMLAAEFSVCTDGVYFSFYFLVDIWWIFSGQSPTATGLCEAVSFSIFRITSRDELLGGIDCEQQK